jgi:hypothetical protein
MSKTLLTAVFAFIFASLLLVTGYASFHQPVWAWTGLTRAPDNWWTAATLMDAYYGFTTFFIWVIYKERRVLPRIVWFVAIMLLGNMAMSVYVLRQLSRLRPGEDLAQLLASPNP